MHRENTFESVFDCISFTISPMFSNWFSKGARVLQGRGIAPRPWPWNMAVVSLLVTRVRVCVLILLGNS